MQVLQGLHSLHSVQALMQLLHAVYALQVLMQLLKDSPFHVRKEAAYAIANVCAGGGGGTGDLEVGRHPGAGCQMESTTPFLLFVCSALLWLKLSLESLYLHLRRRPAVQVLPPSRCGWLPLHH